MKILVIQTAFIGDAILATAILEKLHENPNYQIDFMVRAGNESLFEEHPYVGKLWIWQKKENKTKNLFRIISAIRKERYDLVINLQRYFSTGLTTVFSGAKQTIGFDKNPLSIFFSKRVAHSFQGAHEIERNQKLIAHLTNTQASKPKLYPQATQQAKIKQVINNTGFPYICIAPSSVWFTKQFPKHKWIELLQRKELEKYSIFLLGAPNDHLLCQEIQHANPQLAITNLAGKLTLLESAALMQGAAMNLVNDSAPMHLASAMNAPTIAILCSTTPTFGFGPLADKAYIIERKMNCRPCGIHGHKACPIQHFNCANQIDVSEIASLLP